MKYKFVEIGVSDYEYLPAPEDGTGLSVEPFMQFVGRVERDNVLWAPFAIGNDRKVVDGYYIPLETIAEIEKRIPNASRWGMRGCNCIGKPHFYIAKRMRRSGLDINEHMEIDKINQITYGDLCFMYRIEEVELLKIDTEGMDGHIIQGMLSQKTHPLPKKIIYENNTASPLELRRLAHNLLLKAGYDLSIKDPDAVAGIKVATLRQ